MNRGAYSLFFVSFIVDILLFLILQGYLFKIFEDKLHTGGETFAFATSLLGHRLCPQTYNFLSNFILLKTKSGISPSIHKDGALGHIDEVLCEHILPKLIEV